MPPSAIASARVLHFLFSFSQKVIKIITFCIFKYILCKTWQKEAIKLSVMIVPNMCRRGHIGHFFEVISPQEDFFGLG